MSILIKGIDMPETNETRMIAITSNGVAFFSTIKGGETSKSEKTEAIQIPKGHGRIIDENEAIENVACFHGTAWLDTDGIKPLLEVEE